MNNPPKLYIYTSRLLIIGTVSVFVLIFAIIIISSTAEAKSAEQKNAKINSYASSPNLVTASFSRIGTGISFFAKSTEKNIISATTQTSSIVLDTSKSVAAAASSALMVGAETFGQVAVATGEGLASGLAVAARIPVNTIDFVSENSFVKSVTVPQDSFEVPIIDPESPELKAALKALPPSPEGNIDSLPKGSPKWPIKGDITAHFGVPHWPYQATHSGIDISDGQASGITPVKPFRPGIVSQTIFSSSGLGNHVIVDHGSGVTSVYAHLATIAVNVGQKVSHSSVIGTEGSTGLSTGPHVHFEVRVNGKATDPLQFIAGHP